MKRLAAALLTIPLLAGPAMATGSISCEGAGDDVSVELVVGSLPVLAIVAASAAVGGDVWAIGDDAANPIVVGQAFAEDGRILVDFTDPNIEGIVIRLRLVSDRDGNDEAMAGTLAITGRGTWPVVCIGP